MCIHSSTYMEHIRLLPVKEAHLADCLKYALHEKEFVIEHTLLGIQYLEFRLASLVLGLVLGFRSLRSFIKCRLDVGAQGGVRFLSEDVKVECGERMGGGIEDWGKEIRALSMLWFLAELVIKIR